MARRDYKALLEGMLTGFLTEQNSGSFLEMTN